MNLRSPSGKKPNNNRFSYLLDSEQSQHRPAQKSDFLKFNLQICTLNPCNFQNELVKQIKIQNEQKKRKTPKLELQSMNFEIFRHKIQEKSSKNSFLSLTPSKVAQNNQFTINNNEISTIEQTKTNEIQTYRQQIQSILMQNNSKNSSLDNLVLTEYKQEISPITHDFQNEKSLENQFNEFIKLELSSSDGSVSSFDFNFHKNHSRTKTQYFQPLKNKEKIQSTGQKSARCVMFQKSQAPFKKNESLHSSIYKNATPPKQRKYFDNNSSTQTISTVKTKEMSNKLQQSSLLQFQNSVSVLLNNELQTAQLKIPKSIRLGRKQNNRKI